MTEESWWQGGVRQRWRHQDGNGDLAKVLNFMWHFISCFTSDGFLTRNSSGGERVCVAHYASWCSGRGVWGAAALEMHSHAHEHKWVLVAVHCFTSSSLSTFQFLIPREASTSRKISYYPERYSPLWRLWFQNVEAWILSRCIPRLGKRGSLWDQGCRKDGNRLCEMVS